MSFKEVKELRKAGKLDEALKLASSDLQNIEEHHKELWKDSFTVEELIELNHGIKSAEKDNSGKLKFSVPADILWAKRALAWVYHDFLKKYSNPASFDSFKENLIKIKELQLPEDEKMVFDSCAWQTGSLVFAMQKEEHVDYRKINDLFSIIRYFHFSKPSDAYSFLYKAFHKGYQNWSGYIDFADWWGFENFRSEDYLKEEYNGKKIMALAEQAYIAYSKKMLEEKIIIKDGVILPSVTDKEKIKQFIPRLNEIIEKHPEYQYPPYFKAKLLLASGDDENALSAFLPFAKQKRNDFWVWELMAEIFSEDKDIQFACYCKALSLKTQEDFLVKIRQSFARMLIERKMYLEARTEIEKISATRSKHEWKLPNQVVNWMEQEWYKSATAKKDNRDLYTMHTKKAEEILFQDIPEEVVAVEFVNQNKNMLSFVKDKKKYGFFNYSGLLKNPNVGDLIKVRFNGDGQEGYYKVLTAKPAESGTTSSALKNFSGQLNLIPHQNFGFVDDIFIDPKIIQDNNLQNSQTIKGKAILSFNKKKNEWGWKAITIDKNN